MSDADCCAVVVPILRGGGLASEPDPSNPVDSGWFPGGRGRTRTADSYRVKAAEAPSEDATLSGDDVTTAEVASVEPCLNDGTEPIHCARFVRSGQLVLWPRSRDLERWER